MHIARHDLRCTLGDVLHTFDGLMQEIPGKGGFQVSDVGAQVSHAPFHDTDGRLEVPTNGKDIRERFLQ